MKQLGSLAHITDTITQCRAQCEAEGGPFHADALAAALGISYETLVEYANGRGSVAALLTAALQECTASVIAHALCADPKSHPLWMFYLRNRAHFADKGEQRCELPVGGGVQFVGEEKIQ